MHGELKVKILIYQFFIYLCIHIYLFNENVRSSDHRVSNGRIISERWITKNVEGKGRDPIFSINPAFSWITMDSPSLGRYLNAEHTIFERTVLYTHLRSYSKSRQTNATSSSQVIPCLITKKPTKQTSVWKQLSRLCVVRGRKTLRTFVPPDGHPCRVPCYHVPGELAIWVTKNGQGHKSPIHGLDTLSKHPAKITHSSQS
jgi:hypothetical protein